jgi:adenosylcobinamide kinase/adenosylcobinamide-phosphate guanylyltransferase
MAVVLITGGIRSGKSRFAENYLLDHGERPWIYLPTGTASDEEFRERIARHRKNRDMRFETLEGFTRDWNWEMASSSSLHGIPETASILVDSMGLMLSAALERHPAESIPEIVQRIVPFLDFLRTRPGLGLVVSEEVGLGGVPMTSLGRRFADCLGECNQLVASRSESVYFMAAGYPILLKSKP